MIDLTNAPTVAEHVKRCSYSKIWLCPSIVHTNRIDPGPLLKGIECSKSTIPEPLKDKLVRRRFAENNTECIIWENDNEQALLDFEDKQKREE